MRIRRPEAAAAATEAHAIESVIAPLENYTREVPLRIQAAAGWKRARPPTPAVWLVGEIGRGGTWSLEDLAQGAEADVTMTLGGGRHGGDRARDHRQRRAIVPRGAAATRSGPRHHQPGDYAIRVTLKGPAAGATASRDTVRLALATPPDATGAIVMRSGQSTGNREVRDRRLALPPQRAHSCRSTGPERVRDFRRAFLIAWASH